MNQADVRRAVPLFHSAHAHRAFDSVARQVEASLVGRIRGVLGHDAATTASRLMQRIVELAFADFVAQCALRIRRGDAPIPAADRLSSWGGIYFDPQTGSVCSSVKLFLRSMAEFAAHWGLVAWAIIAGFFRRADVRRATLVIGVTPECLYAEGSDTRFASYCRSGPIRPLVSADRLIVQSALSLPLSVSDRVQYVRFPLLAAARSAPFGFFGRARLLWTHLSMLVNFICVAARRPLLAVLARDAAELAVVGELDRCGRIADVIVTNSAYSSQPLWMRGQRRFRTHMVWYSQNTIPFVFKADGIRSDVPNYRHMVIDAHWVWTKGYADYLRSLGVPGEFHVCGPIMWYLREPAAARDDEEVRVVLFDITPITSERAEKIGLLYNYYCAENMIRFIEESVAACREIGQRLKRPVKILLKHKRDYNFSHDKSYITMISRLIAAGAVELVAYQTNVYALLDSCDLSIVVPYSSPVHVATNVGRPAIYFDATGELEPSFDRTPGVSFAASREELLRIAMDSLGARTRSQ